MFKGVIAGLALSWATATMAQPTSPTFSERVAAARLDISLENGELRGPGAELLAREIGRAQFLVVGEQHGTATIAEVAAALHRQAASSGYNHAAFEIGPNTAGEVERMIRSGPGQLARFLRQPGNAFSIAFLFWAEETALAEQAVAQSSAAHQVIWGVDQEFVGSLPLLLPIIEQFARTEAQRAALASLRTRSAAEPMLLGLMEASQLDQLRSAFPPADYPEAAALIADLTISNGIYGAFVRREGSGLDANITREVYMRRNFLRYFTAAETETGLPPRVFLKFGANHAIRGHNFTNVPALGNFIAEWGLSRGFDMVNIFVSCIGGEMNDPRSGENSPCNDYEELPADSPLRPQGAEGPLTLIDLRPLRRTSSGVDPQTRRIILGFDFYLAVHNPAPATPLVPRQ